MGILPGIGVGYTNNSTSKEAARKVAPKAPNIRERVAGHVRWCGQNGATPDEVAVALGLLIVTARPRCTELVKLGRLRDSGMRRMNENGNNAIVYVATNPQ